MHNENIEVIDEGHDRKYFSIIPNYVIDTQSPHALLLYMTIKRYAGDNGTCYVGHKQLTKMIGVRNGTLKKYLDELIADKLIIEVGGRLVETNGGLQMSKTYAITDIWVKNSIHFSDAKEDVKGGSNGYHPLQRGVKRVPKGCQTGTSKNIYIKNINKKIAIDEQSPDIPVIINLFKEVNPSYNRLFGNRTERQCTLRLIKQYGVEKLTEMISSLPDIVKMPYAPKITTPFEFEKNIGKLLAFIQQQKNMQNNKKPNIII